MELENTVFPLSQTTSTIPPEENSDKNLRRNDKSVYLVSVVNPLTVNVPLT